MHVEQMTYWSKLVEHYYDNEHWKKSDVAPSGSIAEWINHEFGGNLDWQDRKIHFKDPKRLSWFILRWS